MLKEGEKAPEFCLPNQDGKNVRLQDFKGQWVVLYFYPKDNTPGCTIEAIDFSNHIRDYQKLDAVILGISPDSSQSHCNFIEKQELKITLLSDLEHTMLEKYCAWQLKKNYGKEYWGVVRSTFLIDPDGKIAAAWPKVNVQGHVEEVKQKLKECLTTRVK